MSTRDIVKKDPADFTPTLGNYKDLQPFRFWCQKVLPLVYDDSLSYYELLCKVVDYLNKTMEDVGVLEGDVTGLHEAYKKLQEYVNDYFSTLDVQEEINNKLDAMAKDGSLSALLKAIISDNSLPKFVNSVSEMTNTLLVYVLKSNGHIYYYDSGNWKDSGLVYGSFNSYAPSDIIILKSNVDTYFNNLNNAPLNKTIYLYKITGDIMKNLPISPATGCLSTFQYSDRSNQPGGYQLFVSENRVFTRSNTGSAPNFIWGNWIELSNTKEEKTYYPNGFNLFRKFCSVGDSLSVGYHTLKNGTAVSEDKEISWGSFIKNKYNNDVYWSGKSGATCLSWLNETSEEWGLKYAKKIGKMPLYILCMGANEVNQTIGSESDIGTTNDTLYSYVSRVISELRKISPDCFIISTGVSRGVGVTTSVVNVNNVYKKMEQHYSNYYYMDCINEFNSLPFTSLYNNYHYTAIGYNSMAELFSDKLDEIIKKHLQDFLYV
jgi:hypothetical protein